jgi:adenine-specific DNA-methyltransferase
LLTPDERIAQIVTYYRRRPSPDALASSLALLGQEAPGEVATLLAGLKPAWSDHAVASVYAALMGKSRRRALGAYFTPPGLVDYLLKRAQQFGVDLASGRLRDPAAAARRSSCRSRERWSACGGPRRSTMRPSSSGSLSD